MKVYSVWTTYHAQNAIRINGLQGFVIGVIGVIGVILIIASVMGVIGGQGSIVAVTGPITHLSRTYHGGK